MVDDYSGYKALFGVGITELGCMGHARRKFFELYAANKSGIARAIDYSIKRWPAMARYATSGRLPIDNNPIENAIWPMAIGKKNWLFAGFERAGGRRRSRVCSARPS